MTQGAGRGPDVGHGGTTAHGTGGAPFPVVGSPAGAPGPKTAGPGASADPRTTGLPSGAPAPSGPPPSAESRAKGDTSTLHLAGLPAGTGVPAGAAQAAQAALAAEPAGAPRAAGAASAAGAAEPVGPGAPVDPGAAAGPGAPAVTEGGVTRAASPPETPPAPEEEGPRDYTPTARDLPVISSPDVPEPTMVDVPSPVSSNEGDGPLYVVGDVHGYLDELRAALRQFGIIDSDDRWIADNARLWFLGDFTDRGPDGIGVIDLVMQLSAEAAAAGGYCKALMGNHELLLLGAARFGDTPVNSGAGTASFQAAWLLNGGQRTDMERLRDHHLQWMSRLDAIALADHHLLVHSDATCYLDYGDTIEAVNDAITVALQRNDADETWDLFRKFTKRFAFREESSGPQAVHELLDVFGGKRIVHGHSPIPYLLGEVGSEDEDSAPNVTGPHVYADGLAVAMDGGVTMAGKLLIAQLPLAQ